MNGFSLAARAMGRGLARFGGAMRKGIGNLGGGGPFANSVRFPALLGWGSNLSDIQLESYARGAATVATCVAVYASRMADPDIVIEQKVGTRKWERLEDDSPAFGGIARVFARPNRDMGKTALWTLAHGSKATFGRAPILTDYQNFHAPVVPGRTFPRELRYLYAATTTPEFDGRAPRPTGYRYSDPVTGATLELRPDEVFYDTLPRMDDPWQGASLVARAAVFAVLQREMGKYHIGYFRNGARAGVVLESDKPISDVQMKKLRAEWKEEYGSLEGKAFTTWFLHSGFKLKDLGDGQKDADFPNLFRLTKEEIGGSFRIPPVFLNDYSEAALANIEQQTPILYEGCCMPDGKIFSENLTEVMGERFDPARKIRIRLDWDGVAAVKRMNLNQLVSLATAAGAPVISRNEARELRSLKPMPEGEGLLVPFSMTDRGVGAVPDALAPESGTAPKPKPESGAIAPGKVRTLGKWIDSAARNTKRVQHESSMGRFVPSSERELRAFFTNQEQRTLARLPSAMKDVSGIVTKDDDFFDDEFESDAIAQVIMRIQMRVASVRGQEATEEVGGRPSDFLLSDPRVQAFIRDTGYRSGKLITGTTADRLREVLADAVANGQTLSEVTTEIRDLFAVRRFEAARIARTEVTRGYNATSTMAWAQTNVVESQEWLTAHDDKVRDSHAEIDGEEQPLDGTFSNGCAYPGDPAAPPDETINCRCTTLPVLKSEGERGWKISPALREAFAKKS